MLRISGTITYVKTDTTKDGDSYTLARVEGLTGIVAGKGYDPQVGDQVSGGAEISWDSTNKRQRVTLFIKPLGLAHRPIDTNGYHPVADALHDHPEF